MSNKEQNQESKSWPDLVHANSADGLPSAKTHDWFPSTLGLETSVLKATKALQVVKTSAARKKKSTTVANLDT